MANYMTADASDSARCSLALEPARQLVAVCGRIMQLAVISLIEQYSYHIKISLTNEVIILRIKSLIIDALAAAIF
jgi:hypothetical protein